MRLHSPVLVTRQLGRLRNFYADVLGLHVVEDFGACIVLSCGISIWQPGSDHPVQPTDTQQASGCGGSPGYPFELCFEADTVAEFETVAGALQRSGLPLVHGVRVENWGQRTLRVEDPDGNLVEWGESIPCFVRRLYDDGNSVTEVAAKTGIALERVQELVS